MASLQVETDVSESNIEKLKPGQPCEIQLDAVPDTRFPGTIHMIVPTADRSKATVMVKVRFNTIDSRILPEMSAKVAFLSREVKKEEEKSRTAVSPKAIIDDGRKEIPFCGETGPGQTDSGNNRRAIGRHGGDTRVEQSPATK